MAKKIEIMWGQSIQKRDNIMRKHCFNKLDVNVICYLKLNKVLFCCRIWSVFVTSDEDKKIRKENWSTTHKEQFFFNNIDV